MTYDEKQVLLKNGKLCVLKSPGEEDAADMLTYLRQIAAETCFMVRFPDEVTLTPEEEAALLAAQLESSHSLMINARVDGKLAGNAGISVVAQRRKLCHRATLGIALKKEFWGMGIGGLLMREIEQQAKEMGFSQLELGVFSDNERAAALYEKCGFERWGQIQNAFRLADGSFRDEILMGKIL